MQGQEEEGQGPGGLAGRLSPRAWPPDSPRGPPELVVAESVVVIKKLLQMQPAQHGEIIKHLAKLTDNIQVRGAPPCVPSLPRRPPCGFKVL